MNTSNYFFEYQVIPALLEQVKTNQNPIQSLIDIEWIKTILVSSKATIDWDAFSIDIYDEKNKKTTLERGKYIAYTFPKITCPPEAKYGVIDIQAKKYYTFESDFNKDTWAIGNQEKETHHLIGFVDRDMSMEEFLKSIKGGSRLSGNNKSGCLSVIAFIIVVTIGTFLTQI